MARASRLRSGCPCGRSSTARAPAFQAGGAGSIPVARSSPPTRCSALKVSEKLVLGAAAVLVVVGAALAVIQPGDLSEEDTAAPAQATTSTTEGGGRPDDTAAPATSETTTTAVTPTTPAPSTETTAPADPPASVAGSGLNVGAPPTGGSDGVADTGGESMLGIGLALAAAGIVLRRAARPSG